MLIQGQVSVVKSADHMRSRARKARVNVPAGKATIGSTDASTATVSYFYIVRISALLCRKIYINIIYLSAIYIQHYARMCSYTFCGQVIVMK